MDLPIALAVSDVCAWQKEIYHTGLRHLESEQYLLGASQFSSLRFSNCGPQVRENALFGYGYAMWKLDEAVELKNTISMGYKTLTRERFAVLEKMAFGEASDQHS